MFVTSGTNARFWNGFEIDLGMWPPISSGQVTLVEDACFRHLKAWEQKGKREMILFQLRLGSAAVPNQASETVILSLFVSYSEESIHQMRLYIKIGSRKASRFVKIRRPKYGQRQPLPFLEDIQVSAAWAFVYVASSAILVFSGGCVELSFCQEDGYPTTILVQYGWDGR